MKTSIMKALPDFGLGTQMALGGKNLRSGGVTRITLAAVSIGAALMVLLMAVSFPHAYQARQDHAESRLLDASPRAGVNPVHVWTLTTSIGKYDITGIYLYAAGPNAPVPPGLSALPASGETYASPAFLRMAQTSDGANFLKTIPGKIVGTIAPAGLRGPADVRFYGGADSSIVTDQNAVYGFGVQVRHEPLAAAYVALISLVAAVVLVPVLISLVTSLRIGGMERDRRLSAIRLLGASRSQLMRMASAESLCGAAAGMILGALGFLGSRRIAETFDLGGVSFFANDFSASWWKYAMVMALAPILAVATSFLGLRKSTFDPLGTVKSVVPKRKVLWWRVFPLAAGVTLLVAANMAKNSSTWYPLALIAGVVLAIASVVLILPWVLEKSVHRVRAVQRPALLLAVRRLQMDSSTPARVVSGVIVLLTGVMSVQMVLSSMEAKQSQWQTQYTQTSSRASMSVSASSSVGEQVLAAMRSVPGGQDAWLERGARLSRDAQGMDSWQVSVMDCATITRVVGVPCVDGQVFEAVKQLSSERVLPGETLHSASNGRGAMDITLPSVITTIENANALDYDVFMTPKSLSEVDRSKFGSASITMPYSAGDKALVQAVREVLVPFTWHVGYISDGLPHYANREADQTTRFKHYIAYAFLALLFLAGLSLLALSLEQIQHRRQPLAVLSAIGVRRRIVALSVLWQNMLPLLLGVVLAVATAFVVSILVLRLSTNYPFAMDWSLFFLQIASCIGLGLLIAVGSLPALLGASRFDNLRTE